VTAALDRPATLPRLFRALLDARRARCMRTTAVLLLALGLAQGCAVIAVADATVTVAATVVKAGAAVAGAAIDVTAAGVRAVTAEDEPEKPTE